MRRGKEATKQLFSMLTCLFLIMPVALAAVAGPNSPALVADNASFGTKSWDNPSDARVSDEDYTEAELNDFENSTYLKATNFSFALPANAIIHGIQADVERHVSSTSGGSIVRDAVVRLLKSGNILGADRATNTSFTATDTYESHGGMNDLWDLGWTATDLNDPGFGIVFAATKANDASSQRTALVNHISITINYSIDNSSPVITLLGSNPDIIEYGTPYADPGATAVDDFSGNITGAIIVASNVNTSVLGNYSILYTVNDSVGNTANATRAVSVVDTTPPVITLLGPDPVTIEVGTPYADAGATAFDNHDSNITSSIIANNPVNPSVLGTYVVTYDVADSSGNAAMQATRTVEVVDTTPPLIQLVGSDATITAGSGYGDLGATANDAYDGNITLAIVANDSVDARRPGGYTVVYSVNDSSGNAALPVTRNVSVVAPIEGSHYPSLGPKTFSYFNRQPGTLPPGTAFATVKAAFPASPATASVPTTALASSAIVGSIGAAGTGEAGGEATAGASTAPTGSEGPVSSAAFGSPSTMTGAVTGTRATTPWTWAVILGILILGMLMLAQRYRRNPRLKEFLRRWKP